jgi:hypothetical protein
MLLYRVTEANLVDTVTVIQNKEEFSFTNYIDT